MKTFQSIFAWIRGAAQALVTDISKAFNLEKSVFPFIQQQFFYLLWIFVVPALLYFMAQGRELLVGFFDDNTFVAGFRAAALLLVYLLTSLTVLMSPWPFFPKKKPEDWARINPFTWAKPGATYAMSVLPAVLSCAPESTSWLKKPLRVEIMGIPRVVGLVIQGRRLAFNAPSQRKRRLYSDNVFTTPNRIVS